MRARSWMAALALMIGGAGFLAARGLPARGPARALKPGGDDAPARPLPPPTMSRAMAPLPSIAVEATGAKADGSHLDQARLTLVIAGLGPDGCNVEIRPANAGCKFQVPPPRHVSTEGTAQVVLNNVEVRGADHMLTVAITVREPGQPPETLYRGFRMARPATTSAPAPSTANSPRPAPTPVPRFASFTCYLSSRVAGVEPAAIRR